MKRKLGPLRAAGSREGLTKSQAEAELRRLIREVRPVERRERVTIEEAGNAYIAHVRDFLERKPSTVQDYRGILRQIARFFGSRGVDQIRPADVTEHAAAKGAEGRSTKTIANHLNFLHGLLAFAVKRGWATANAVAVTDRPRCPGPDPDIRFLDRSEVEALLDAVSDDRLGPTDRALYMVAAMCGLRQGELVALRWRDVDWEVGVIRVRRNFTRGRFGTPKSRRSSRAVPMPGRVAAELERHRQRSAYATDSDLVLCHPDTGRPYDASKLRKRFKAAVSAAGIREIRFHDLRHTFGTRMAAAGAPLRNIQEWMGHRDYKTTLIYADYAPDPSQGARWAEAAFGH
ncbi:MAG: site-specific integrase [Solirubrobacterales bacterium]